MNIYVSVDLWTDGDFDLKPELPKYENDVTRKFEDYHISHVFNGEEAEIKKEIKYFLKTILFHIKFTYGHYYLMNTIYHFFDEGICKVDSMGTRDYFSNGLYGNYDGSRIVIEVF